MSPRWKRGVSRLNGFMGEAVGKSYVEKHFPEEAKHAMEGLQHGGSRILADV